MQAGTWYIGVANNAGRATENLNAKLSVVVAPPGELPCLLNCNPVGPSNLEG